MVPSGFPTGTVSSGRSDPSSTTVARERDGNAGGDPQARIAELERENEALRAAVEKQRRENERIVERYERLLDCDPGGEGATDDGGTSRDEAALSAGRAETGLLERAVDLFTYRG